MKSLVTASSVRIIWSGGHDPESLRPPGPAPAAELTPPRRAAAAAAPLREAPPRRLGPDRREGGQVRGQKVYQYTAIDDCTRFRALRLYRRQNQRSTLAFFSEIREALPFPIRRLQCDNGSEFPLAFALTVQEAGIGLRYITPRHPEQNGKVERSHRIDSEEFWTRQDFTSFDQAARALGDWERIYNFARFSMALHGETPAEKLQRLLPDVQVA